MTESNKEDKDYYKLLLKPSIVKFFLSFSFF